MIQPCDGFVNYVASFGAQVCIRTHCHYTSLHGDDGNMKHTVRKKAWHRRAQMRPVSAV